VYSEESAKRSISNIRSRAESETHGLAPAVVTGFSNSPVLLAVGGAPWAVATSAGFSRDAGVCSISRIPQRRHTPRLDETTSLCIGQVNDFVGFPFLLESLAND
jgi:hypothetical protein